MKKTFLNWSSGKDCAMALHLMQQSGEYDLQKLKNAWVTISFDLSQKHITANYE